MKKILITVFARMLLPEIVSAGKRYNVIMQSSSRDGPVKHGRLMGRDVAWALKVLGRLSVVF